MNQQWIYSSGIEACTIRSAIINTVTLKSVCPFLIPDMCDLKCVTWKQRSCGTIGISKVKDKE